MQSGQLRRLASFRLGGLHNNISQHIRSFAHRSAALLRWQYASRSFITFTNCLILSISWNMSASASRYTFSTLFSSTLGALGMLGSHARVILQPVQLPSSTQKLHPLKGTHDSDHIFSRLHLQDDNFRRSCCKHNPAHHQQHEESAKYPPGQTV